MFLHGINFRAVFLHFIVVLTRRQIIPAQCKDKDMEKLNIIKMHLKINLNF